jgi:hypothetical protein
MLVVVARNCLYEQLEFITVIRAEVYATSYANAAFRYTAYLGPSHEHSPPAWRFVQ